MTKRRNRLRGFLWRWFILLLFFAMALAVVGDLSGVTLPYMGFVAVILAALAVLMQETDYRLLGRDM